MSFYYRRLHGNLVLIDGASIPAGEDGSIQYNDGDLEGTQYVKITEDGYFSLISTATPATNGNSILFSDIADDLLKYKNSEGDIIGLGVSVTGTGVVKATGGTIDSAASTIVDADVSGSAAIAGTKISSNFGSQLVTTTGNIRADGYLGAGIGPYATAGAIRLANASVIAARTSANNADMPIAEVSSLNHLLIGSNNANTGDTFIRANGAIYLRPSGGSTTFQTTSALVSSLQPLAVGTNPASQGTLRLQGGNSFVLVTRNAANNGDIIWLSQDGGNNMSIGTQSGNNINIQTGGTLQMFRGSSIVIDYNGTVIRNLLPVAYTATNPASVGQHRYGNNVGSLIVQRNGANSADLVGFAMNATDGYLASSTSQTTNLSNLHISPSSTITLNVGSTNVMTVDSTSQITLRNSTTRQLATTTTDAIDVTANVQTTDNTITNLYTWTLDNNAVTTIDIRVTACRSNSAEADAWVGTITFVNAAGSITEVDAADIIQRGATAWVVTLDNSGTTARVRVTGETSKTIEWGCTVSRQVTRQS